MSKVKQPDAGISSHHTRFRRLTPICRPTVLVHKETTTGPQLLEVIPAICIQFHNMRLVLSRKAAPLMSRFSVDGGGGEGGWRWSQDRQPNPTSNTTSALHESPEAFHHVRPAAASRPLSRRRRVTFGRPVRTPTTRRLPAHMTSPLAGRRRISSAAQSSTRSLTWRAHTLWMRPSAATRAARTVAATSIGSAS